MAKYEKWLQEENLIKISGWARDGLIDKEIAAQMGISYSTLREWRDRFPALSAALKIGKDVADRKVEHKLFDKAVGFTQKVQKPIKLKRTIYENGKKVEEYEYIKMVEEEVYIPPEASCQFFWLKNRKPKEWKDKQQVDANVNGQVSIEDYLRDKGKLDF